MATCQGSKCESRQLWKHWHARDVSNWKWQGQIELENVFGFFSMSCTKIETFLAKLLFLRVFIITLVA